jgi:hypothetical protein
VVQVDAAALVNSMLQLTNCFPKVGVPSEIQKNLHFGIGMKKEGAGINLSEI